jgi:N-acetylglucosaminyldiphosphoundecaprenol N-acetyl-beta-D-mannosaminyltransferase
VADFAIDRSASDISRLERPTEDRFDVLGIPVSVTSIKDASNRILTWSNDARGRYICVRDVHGIMRARDDARLKRIHEEADLVTPDGMPLVMLGRLHGKPVSRTCGPDLMEHVCAHSAKTGLKHYFYGGDEGVGETLKARFEERFPGIQIVGTESPPFRPATPEEDEATIKKIIESGADVVWVGLSTPKQEHWMRAHRDRLPATLIGVGAAYDFHSGRVQRAPVWMQRHALEWLHRLVSEPRRLWRRYLVMAPQFAVLALAEYLHLGDSRTPET